MHSRKFPTREEAKQYLETKGTLTYYGRAGIHYEYCVYTLTLHNGIQYRVDLYDDGKVVVPDK